MKTLRFALIVLTIAGFILWRANPPLFYSLFTSFQQNTNSLVAKSTQFKLPPEVKSAIDKKQKEITVEVQKQAAIVTDKVAIESKKTIAETVQTTAQEITKLLATKTDDVLGILTTRQNQEPQVVVTKTISDPLAEIKTINFASPVVQKFTLKAKEKNYLKFQNIPPKMCLYINGVKYSTENDAYVAIIFPVVGTYSLSLDYCSISDKQLGEIVVE